MSTFLLCLHIGAALLIGRDAYRRGRSFIVWTALTLLPPFGILLTWPLLVMLPRLTPLEQATVLATPAPVDLRPTSSNKSFYMFVTAWVFFLIYGLAMVVK